MKRQNNGASTIPIKHVFIVWTLNQSLSISNCSQDFRTNYTIHLKFSSVSFNSIRFDSYHTHHQNNAFSHQLKKSRFFTNFLHAVRFPSIRVGFLLTCKKITNGSSKKQTIISHSIIRSDSSKPRRSRERKMPFHLIFVSKA